MKFATQDKNGVAIVNCLRLHGEMTIREASEMLGLDLKRTDQTMRRLMLQSNVEQTGKRKRVGSGRSAMIYRWLDIDAPDKPEPMMNVYERKRAIAMTDQLIQAMRTTVDPSVFDPFRVLRAQVGAV